MDCLIKHTYLHTKLKYTPQRNLFVARNVGQQLVQSRQSLAEAVFSSIQMLELLHIHKQQQYHFPVPPSLTVLVCRSAAHRVVETRTGMVSVAVCVCSVHSNVSD